MNCKQIHSSIQDYVDGYCDSTVKQVVDIHIESCESCNKYLNSIKCMKNALSDFPVPEKTELQWKQIECLIYENLDTLKIVSDNRTPKRILSYRVYAIAAVLVLMLISLPLIYMKNNGNSTVVANTKYPSISNIHGNVTKDGHAYGPSGQDFSFGKGEEISTPANSKVSIKTDSGSTIELAENSSISVENYSKDNQKYLLKYGTASVEVAKRKQGQLFIVQTPNALCEVVGTKFTVDIIQLNPGIKTVLSVSEGKVRLKTNSGDSLLVATGNSRSITNGQIDSITSLIDNITINNEIQENPRQHNSTKPLSKILKDSNRIAKQGHEVVKSTYGDATIAYEQSIANAIKFADSGNLDDALVLLDSLIKSGTLSVSDLYDVYMRKVRLLKIQKRYSEVSGILETIIDGNFKRENKGNALLQYAILKKSELHDEDGAINVYKRYIRECGDCLMITEAYYSLAELLHSRNQYQEEVKIYEEIVEKFAEQAGVERAVYSLAQLYSSTLGNCAKAVEFFTRLEKKYPDSKFTEDAIFWKANCLYTQGKFTQAVGVYRQYLVKYPNGRWSSEAQARTSETESAGRNR